MKRCLTLLFFTLPIFAHAATMPAFPTPHMVWDGDAMQSTFTPNTYAAMLVSASGTGTDWAPLTGTGGAAITPNSYAGLLVCTANCSNPLSQVWSPWTGAGGGGGSLPTATTSGQVPVSSGAGTTYTAQSLPASSLSYTGLVATATFWPQSYNPSYTWVMAAAPSIVQSAVPANGQRLLFINSYGSEAAVSSATYKVSIEYPIGTTPTVCTFSGSQTTTVASKAVFLTDPCGPAVPLGAIENIRTLRTSTGGIFLSGHNGANSLLSGFEFGTGTPDDKTGSGTVGNPGFSYSFGPQAIIGTTTSPSVCIAGDSRQFGAGDNVTDLRLDVGELGRIIGPVYAYADMGMTAETAQTAVSNYALRSQIFQYCTTVIDPYGINDKTNGAATDAQLVAYRTQFAALATGKMVWGTTLPAVTSSTDNWATLANQTTTTDPRAFNALVRAGITGEAGYIDIARAVDPTDSGKWPVSPNLFAATGTANYATPDGTHENATMNSLIAKTLGYVNLWFHR